MNREAGTRRWTRVAVALLLLAAGACTTLTTQEGGSRPRALLGSNGARPSAPKGWFQTACRVSPSLLERTARGYWPGRGPDLTFIPRGGNPFGNLPFSTTHSGPWPFLQRVPLVLYGPGFIRAQGEVRLDREVTLADVVPTLSKLLQTPPPGTATGRAIGRALLPPNQRSKQLKLIVTVVWDGGGTNVLERWPGAWPWLRSIMQRGTSVTNATVGSSPSVTPAVHATLGTGTWPNRHGIVNILQRDEGTMAASFEGITPSRLETETLADVFDRRTGNRAKVATVAKDAFHLGMMGHGAYVPGGDRDIAALTSAGEGASPLGTNEQWYRLPRYLLRIPGVDAAVQSVDRADGRLDGRWMGHEISEGTDDELRFSRAPVWTILQTNISKLLLKTEGFGQDRVPDLFFTNYKDIDYAGHAFNFYQPEVRDTVEHADAALEELAGFLDETVGRRQWVLVVTADHGQAPLPQKVGDWPIRVGSLREAVTNFAEADTEPVIEHIKQNGIWFDSEVLRSTRANLEQISNWLLEYSIGDNAGRTDVPDEYLGRLDEPVFEAAFPSSELRRILRCAKARSDQA